MRISAICCAILVCASILPGQSGTEVGAGAPNEYIRSLFVNAYNRGRFAALAGAPLGAVRRFGPTGLIQEFQGSGAARAALVRSTTLSEPDNTLADVFQVLPDIYAYYASVGVTTAGYPVNDSLICPNASCQYQIFSSNHALVSWSAGTNEVDNITVKDVFYTRWLANGGAAVMGPPTTAEQDITSSFGSTARTQRFTNSAIYNISSGPLSGRLVSVRPPVAALYFARGAHAGQLGLPATEEMIQSNGARRQSFEGGSIEYQGNSPPVIRTPIYSIVLRPAATPVRMNLGETVTLQAAPISTDGQELSDRPVAFSTSNGRVISLQTSGQTVTVRAVGGGTANLTATSEGKVSLPVTFIVSAPCCQIGEGAPTALMQQAMQDAVVRNRLNVRLPGPERVRRSGAGYVQEFQSADASATRYLIAISDKSAPAFVVAGAVLNRYEQLGGPAAFLGYPIGDASAGGRQVFEGGALAGSPVHLVAGTALQKWSALGYEAGAAGLPTGEAARITSFLGAVGQVQSFEKGVIVSTTKGAFHVSGLILARYLALNGALGAMGFPTADEVTVAGKRRQDFEGGSIEYSAGDTQANAIFKDRKPAVLAAPASVLPGARLRLTASGFSEGSMLRITGGSDPEFRVQTSTGSYVWDVYVPANTPAGPVRVRAIDAANASASAETTYMVRSLGEARARLVRVLGDTQNGVPGNVLTLPLRVAVQDDAGTPLAGITVRFTASPGAEVIPPSAETDINGLAETQLKMPPVEGVALVNVEALRQVTTFSARAAAVSLSGFPKLMQTGSGTMMAAAASIIRRLQMRGDVPSPNGLADVATLEQFLKSFCTVDYQGTQYCDGFLTPSTNEEQIVNLWRLPAFAGQAFEIRIGKADQSLARGAISHGLPVLLPLLLQRNGVPAGVHYVVATGINADSSLQIHDPNSQFARQHLNDYIRGFTAGADRWTGRLAAVAEFLPGRTTHTSFLVVSASESISISSRAGACGETLELPVPGGRDILRARGCDGAAGEYQVEIGGQGTVRAFITDLADNGARFQVAGSSAAFRASRPGPWLIVASQETAIATEGIVNAATFTPEIAVGSLIDIFGSGLSRVGTATKVSVGGREVPVVAAVPFQVNAAIPLDISPGTHMLQIETAYGTAEEPVEIRPSAPAVFSTGIGQPAVLNEDGKLNTATNPVRRGSAVVIYGTGFGPVKTNNSLFVTEASVSASILNQDLPIMFSGLAPGFIGLYQIHVSITLTTPVGSAVPLVIRQAGIETRPVEVAIQ